MRTLKNALVILLLWTVQGIAFLTDFYITDRQGRTRSQRMEHMSEMSSPQEAECYITVTKKIPGQCVSLGSSTSGCMSTREFGSVFHPFHPEC